MNRLFYILAITTIIFLVYRNKPETFINFNRFGMSQIKDLSRRVSKLEYDLHQNKYHNKIEEKIKAIDLKYKNAYNYYKYKQEKNKAAADALLKEVSGE
tara:strand:- start:3742 stop:4038 length:297 start_codon:yes stop_codon:yes gene_type:complete